jgi:membrane peptidoglycan carboxypeptidase
VVANKAVSAFRRLLAEARAVNRVRHRRHPAYAVLSDSDDALWAAVRRLPARQAQAVALRYIADLDTTAIAAALGCTEGNVRVFGKPGRTPGGREAWFAGSTPDLTTVAWAGIHDGDAPLDGAVLPRELWRSYMEQAADPDGLAFPG